MGEIMHGHTAETYFLIIRLKYAIKFKFHVFVCVCVCMTMNVYHRRLMYFLDFVKKKLILCCVVMEDSSYLF